jgi:hypothetical protein
MHMSSRILFDQVWGKLRDAVDSEGTIQIPADRLTKLMKAMRRSEADIKEGVRRKLAAERPKASAAQRLAGHERHRHVEGAT